MQGYPYGQGLSTGYYGYPPPNVPSMMPPNMYGQPPVPMMPGGSAIRISAPPTPSVASANKATTIYVGKISPGLDDDFMRQLLDVSFSFFYFSWPQLCGTVTLWKRLPDPDTGRPKVGVCACIICSY